jgi:hypothetical protein
LAGASVFLDSYLTIRVSTFLGYSLIIGVSTFLGSYFITGASIFLGYSLITGVWRTLTGSGIETFYSFLTTVLATAYLTSKLYCADTFFSTNSFGFY